MSNKSDSQRKGICRLGDVLSVRRGQTIKASLAKGSTGAPLLGMGVFALDGGFRHHNIRFYSGPVVPRGQVSPGDTLVAITDMGQNVLILGRPARVPQALGDSSVVSADVGIVDWKTENAYLRSYAYWVMRTAEFREHCLRHATGTTVRRVKSGDIESFLIGDPYSESSRNLVDTLEAIECKRQLNSRMCATLQDFARTQFRLWHPVPSDTADSSLPEGWTIESLDSIAHYLNGAACQKYPATKGQLHLPVIKIRELNQGITPNTDIAAHDIPEKWHVDDGDVLFSWSGTLVAKIWTGGKGALNQHLFKVTSDRYPRWFFYLWTLHHLDEFRRIAGEKATTMGHIKRRHLTEAICTVPPEVVLTKFAEVLGPIVDRHVANELESRTLGEIRDVLLSKLISGEIRVPEAEQTVEAAL